ncbi:MAG: hypothetical protein WD749_09070 [Phycisphaerales bacterium]
MPQLETGFVQTERWLRLSEAAKAALEGMLQFAIFRQVEWTIDGTRRQVAEWLGPETGLGITTIQGGMAELELAGLLRKGRSGAGGPAGFVIAAPLVER